MRIIGGHDYYDSAQAYGHDPKIVFVREDKEVDKNTFKKPLAAFRFVSEEKSKSKSIWYRHKFNSISAKNGRWYFYTCRVIFCGKMYTGVKCHFTPELSIHLPNEKEDVQFFWNEEDFAKWLEQFKAVLCKEESWSGEENVLFKVLDIRGSEYDYIVKNRISIAIYQNEKWFLNCTGLGDRQFYRVFDAVTAFQELDMWMSGALGMPGKPMVEVSDDIRMQKHGMDKWSFRKKVR